MVIFRITLKSPFGTPVASVSATLNEAADPAAWGHARPVMCITPKPSGRVTVEGPHAFTGGDVYTGTPSSSAATLPVPPVTAALGPAVEFPIHSAAFPGTGGSGVRLKLVQRMSNGPPREL